MSGRLIIDALDFAHNAGAHHGKIEVSKLERLQGYLTDDSGELQYSVTGALNKNEKLVLRVAVRGLISLQCQRCLEELGHMLDIQTELLLAQNEHELARLDEDESGECVLAKQDMDVLALVEDEIILSLPISPRHEPQECKANAQVERSAAIGERSPFAALAALKRLN
jgi:uncharacterized protein